MVKKVLAFIFGVIIVLSGFVSYAAGEPAGTGAEVDENVVKQLMGKITPDDAVKLVLKEDKTIEEEASGIIRIDGMDKLESKEKAAVNDFVSYGDINNENVISVVNSVYEYLCLRDLYFKKVILKINEIKDLEDKALARKAIILTDKMIQDQNSMDRTAQEKIEAVMEFISSGKFKYNTRDSYKLWKGFKELLKKYYAQRKVIIYIDKTIKSLEISLQNDMFTKLQNYSEEMEKYNKTDIAERLYEEALKITDNKEAVLKKISQLYKKQGKKQVMIFVDDRKVTANTEPIIKNGTTMVPLRIISEGLKAKVLWDQKTKTVTVQKGGKSILVPVGSKIIKKDTKELTVREPAVIVKGTTMVPIRAISEILDCNVGWYQAEKIVTVNDNFNTEQGTVKNSEVLDTKLFSSDYLKSDIQGKTEEEAVNDILASDDGILTE